MLKKLQLVTLLTWVGFMSYGQVDLSYYLPTDVTYDESIPTPQQVLGYEVGEWHVSHDQLVYYMRTLAAASDRIEIEEIGKTYENRQLMHLVITAQANRANLEEIRKTHVALTNPNSGVNPSDAKVVHWMGYSIHGNEASGSNAALIAAYYLAAARGPVIDDILESTVIIFDPSYNPDGLQRFSTWVNMHKSANLVSDPAAREFDEAWPGGRTNHYWFDLNRDWMPVQLPESKARIAQFQKWKPNVLTDHHEMGTNSTFFFQPGILSRKNPLTPMANVVMTERIAAYHADMLDSIGSLYYSEEGYDDYYVGKGSTYPDLNGSVGILFEQASARGHLQENQFGTLSFPQAIRNHFTTSLSTLRAVHHLRDDLLVMQNEFYKESLSMAGNDAVKAIVFGSEKDPMRSYHLMDLINQHDIDIYPVRTPIRKNGQTFSEGSYLVPLNQPQYRLIKSMFEKRTEFQDSLFYDISTWTLPLAYNLAYAELGAKDYSSSSLGSLIEEPKAPVRKVHGTSDYAYIFEPYGYYTQRAIMRLLDAGVLVEVAHNPHGTSQKTFVRGSVIIPVGIQRDKQSIIEKEIQTIATKDGIDVYALGTGLSTTGSDLGSRELEVIEKPEVAILVGDGVSSYEAGETWHLLDQRYGMKVTLLPASAVNQDISRYTKLVFPSGSYRDISSRGIDNLKKWVASGGVIVAWKSGGKWLAENDISGAKYLKPENDTDGYKRYVDLEQTRGAQVIGGAIFEAKLDLGHPLTYGLDQPTMPLFRNHSYMMEKSTNQYANPLVYTASPLMSGYVSEERLAELEATPAVTVSQLGRGRVINFADNPNFRAFWYGTNKLFMNALFFGQTISSAAAE
ncbi:M14 family zinc carboxypeptidase [Marinoscillum sp.]|uniref:M14 family zinc carboxypeptidase n=1 Tax=Marinoscillum sp. TaxID=2024838 RepID=UPI003BAC8DF1